MKFSLIEKLKVWRLKLLKLASGEVYYINSPQTLPPPLSKDEELKIIEELRKGSSKARDKLVEHNLRLVVYIAKKFENSGVNIEDLISIGTIGLIKAVNTFKADKNIKLATYASRCIENEILMFLRKSSQYRIPFIHGAIHGTLGQITVFLPNTKSYEEMFNLPSIDKELTEEVINDLKNVTSGVPPVIGPTPNIIGCLEAFEAYKIITGIGKVTVAPKILTFDLLDLGSFYLNEL